jgi:hypothetical protein
MSEPVAGLSAQFVPGNLREFISQLRKCAAGGQKAIERRCEVGTHRRDRTEEEDRQWSWWNGYEEALAVVEDKMQRDENRRMT